ncbi:hypothetical protein [Streptomyces sp. NPDC051921]|uniref:hypothetical protein n=1 Tax=Streptomyces sp. NPDC051921 TaxID=3155806 RepID=UPI00343DD3EF
MSRTHRVPAALAALAGLVLVLLGCGTATAVAVGEGPGPVTVTAAATAAVASAPAGGPGCDRGHGDDAGAAAPAVPPRSHGSGELLPALAGQRTPCGGWGADQAAADATPGPAPPELVPPSPLELSILRV